MSVNQWTSDWAKQRPLPQEFATETTSTNDWAKENYNADRGHEFKLYVTQHQTAGRGRYQRTWRDSAHDQTLLSSWSFKLAQPPQPILTPLVGLALYKAAVETWPKIKFALKAPNDLYIGEKKVAGLLVETIAQGSEYRVIVGLGFNALGHPSIDSSGALIDYTSSRQLPENEWKIFLENWFWRLKAAIQDGVLLVLGKNDCKELKAALNAYVALEKPYDEVFNNGSLKSGQTIIEWNTL